MIFRSQKTKILRLIEHGKKEDAKLVTRGGKNGKEVNNGYFIQPIIFSDVKSEMKFAQEEIFGPSTKTRIAEVLYGDKTDFVADVKAASDAFKLGSEWRRMDASASGLLLNKLASLIERDAVELASLETMDNGKPYKDAYLADLPLSIAV
uniref:Aldehyde dehydrogenase domain-containing protein n=1 Tax=Meloidogyne incognita TaxID=6306 RepID=A0A914MJU5_MELIC